MSDIHTRTSATPNHERSTNMTKNDLNDHEKAMLVHITGVCVSVHSYPIGHGLANRGASRLLHLNWEVLQKRGLVPPTEGRTDARTLASLVDKRLLIPSGTTTDRRVRLSRDGVLIAWALNAEPPSQLRLEYAHVLKQISKGVVNVVDGPAAVYSRKAGFSDCFTALELLGYVRAAWMVHLPDPAQACYSIAPTATPEEWPKDSDLPSWAESLQDTYKAGIEAGEQLAMTELGKELKNECSSLPRCRIVSFKNKKSEQDFNSGTGIFSLKY